MRDDNPFRLMRPSELRQLISQNLTLILKNHVSPSGAAAPRRGSLWSGEVVGSDAHLVDRAGAVVNALITSGSPGTVSGSAMIWRGPGPKPKKKDPRVRRDCGMCGTTMRLSLTSRRTTCEVCLGEVRALLKEREELEKGVRPRTVRGSRSERTKK